MIAKICTKCKENRETSLFLKDKYKKDNLSSWCKICIKEYRQSNREKILKKEREYRKNNKDLINKKQRIYWINNKKRKSEHDAKFYKNNKKRIVKNKKKYYQNNKDFLKNKNKINYINNKLKYSSYNKEYYKNNKLKIKEYKEKNKDYIKKYNNSLYKRKIKSDPKFKIRKIISNSIYKSFKKKSLLKNNNSIIKYLAYTIEEFKNHIQNKFESWMNWNNHGNYNPKTWDDNNASTWTWQIDHIIPHSVFNYTNMECEEFKKCWSLENLRPYSAKLNILDGNRR